MNAHSSPTSPVVPIDLLLELPFKIAAPAPRSGPRAANSVPAALRCDQRVAPERAPQNADRREHEEDTSRP